MEDVLITLADASTATLALLVALSALGLVGYCLKLTQHREDD